MTRSSNRTPIPEGWVPNQTVYERGKLLGMDEYRVTVEMNHFIEHAIANGRKLADWQAGARMWLEKSIEFKRPLPYTSQEHVDHVSKSAWPK